MNSYKVVNYHYIRDKSSSGIHACSIDTFKKQFYFLKKSHTLVPLGTLYEYAKEYRAGSYCALTFDDGFIEHHDVAFPLLREHGVVGTFFIIGLPWEGKMPFTHKLHLILSKKSTRELIESLHNFFRGRYIVPEKTRINPRRRFDDILTSNLKETIISLPVPEKNDFIGHVFRELYSDEISITKDTFMSREHVRKLYDGSMNIGSHAFSHQALDTFTKEQQKEDIEKSVKTLTETVSATPSAFSYPHGRYTKETRQILEDLNFSLAVILGGREVTASDEIFSIPRFDTNDIIVE